MIVLISGSYDEASLHAALGGYDSGQWAMGISRMQISKIEVTGVRLVGTYHRCEDWEILFKYAASRIGHLPLEPV